TAAPTPPSHPHALTHSRTHALTHTLKHSRIMSSLHIAKFAKCISGPRMDEPCLQTRGGERRVERMRSDECVIGTFTHALLISLSCLSILSHLIIIFLSFDCFFGSETKPRTVTRKQLQVTETIAPETVAPVAAAPLPRKKKTTKFGIIMLLLPPNVVTRTSAHAHPLVLAHRNSSVEELLGSTVPSC
ncbi:hypothetical protein BGZ63DRAFT_379186, partial [Mariannaea sp. PMI_226]